MIDDPDRSISKTHLEYGIGEQGLWVKDRGSTNGSTLIHRGGEPVPLTPGQQTPVAIGDTVTIGRRSFLVQEAGR